MYQTPTYFLQSLLLDCGRSFVFLSPFPFPISYIALYYYCFILVTMDASMEEL